MPFLSTTRDRARLLILVLAVGVALTLVPYVSGLFGAAVLFVIFVHPYRRLARVVKPGFAAAIILLLALVVVALPLGWVIGLVVAQAPESLQSLESSPLFARMGQWRIYDYDVGAEVAKASGSIISWISTHAIAFLGSATSAVLNLVIAFFGLFYLLQSGDRIWSGVRGYIPFSPQTADALKGRFFSVIEAMLLGTVLIAAIQGSLIGAAFWAVDLSHPLFWGTVTAFASIFPVFGSGIVWLPATIVLLARGEYGHAVVMLVAGAGIASNIDNLIRPLVYRRVSNIHPMITLVGAFAGVRVFGLSGILIGPLAIAYLFELFAFYREEYGTPPDAAVIAPAVP